MYNKVCGSTEKNHAIFGYELMGEQQISHAESTALSIRNELKQRSKTGLYSNRIYILDLNFNHNT